MLPVKLNEDLHERRQGGRMGEMKAHKRVCTMHTLFLKLHAVNHPKSRKRELGQQGLWGCRLSLGHMGAMWASICRGIVFSDCDCKGNR